jgi:hypothetical protein
MNHTFGVVGSTANAGLCSFANPGLEPGAAPLLLSATYMPELIATLRVGSVISGECSTCHEVIVVKGSGIEILEELSYMIKQAFLEHLRKRHSPDSQNN